MYYLTFSIISSTIVYVVFRYLNLFRVNTLHAVIFNYTSCVLLGVIILDAPLTVLTVAPAGLYLLSGLLGTGFIIVFFYMAKTTHYFGIAVASVVSRMSLIIPSLFAIIVYKEPAGILKITGIITGLTAIYLCLHKEKALRLQVVISSGKTPAYLLVIPLLVFMGSGYVDTLIKIVEVNYLSFIPNPVFITLLFSFAMITGYLLLAFDLLLNKTKIELKSVYWGLFLGVFNFFSIYFFLLAFNVTHGHASVIFPINHIGIVILSCLVAVVFFGEKFSFVNVSGFVLSIAAIIMILYMNG